MFAERDLVIATQHKKEQVIGPVLESSLWVKTQTAIGLNTDSFGTFSGEIERKLTPLEAARKKCEEAMKLTNSDLAIASEGSFGTHPASIFSQANEELLLFVDKKNNLEISVSTLTTETNMNGSNVESWKEVLEFADKIGFPSHGLILRDKKESKTILQKGITEMAVLEKTYKQHASKYARLYLETDMRANFNPTRMKVIQETARKLVSRILSLCPECQTPGFGVTEAKQGLPCELCGSPTKSTLAYVKSCSKCDHQKQEMFPHAKQKEDPMYCDRCNP